MTDRDYDAILLDLDGTLLDSNDEIHARTRSALDQARERGVRVMVVTGRSVGSARPILEHLELHEPAVVFNGAGIWCPAKSRLIEERIVSNRTLQRLHEFRRESGHLTVLMSSERMVALEPRNDAEHAAMVGLENMVYLDEAGVSAEENVLRVTFMNAGEEPAIEYADRIQDHLALPAYMTHFPLAILPRHRGSSFQAVDVHAPCRGKAEALRFLHETEGILPERVVAVGDAWNDDPMIEAAGLGVAMGNAVDELKAVADRVIGDHDSAAIGELVEELFL
jgi:Cof subfamily protein (haloacid dehalogenase superfamily)